MKRRYRGSEFIINQMRGISDIVYNALKKDDMETLRGVQAFAVTLWSWVHSGPALISYLLKRTIEERVNKKLKREKFEIGELPLTAETKKELYDNRIWLDFDELRYAVKSLKTAVKFVKGLEGMGFVETWDTNPEEYKDHPGGIKISLTPIWDGVIDRLERDRNETVVFSEDIGRILALSILAELKAENAVRFCGQTSFLPMIRLARKGNNDTTPISIRDAEEIFGSKMKYARMRAIDNRRDPSIRAVKYDNGKELFLTNNFIRTASLIRRRGIQLTRERR